LVYSPGGVCGGGGGGGGSDGCYFESVSEQNAHVRQEKKNKHTYIRISQ